MIWWLNLKENAKNITYRYLPLLKAEMSFLWSRMTLSKSRPISVSRFVVIISGGIARYCNSSQTKSFDYIWHQCLKLWLVNFSSMVGLIIYLSGITHTLKAPIRWPAVLTVLLLLFFVRRHCGNSTCLFLCRIKIHE